MLFVKFNTNSYFNFYILQNSKTPSYERILFYLLFVPVHSNSYSHFILQYEMDQCSCSQYLRVSFANAR